MARTNQSYQGFLLDNQARKCHVEERKAQGLMKFTLSVLSKEAQSSNHTDATLAIRGRGKQGSPRKFSQQL
ncbi:hypothetical protein Tco_0286512 [Tanacetum coccineum]